VGVLAVSAAATEFLSTDQGLWVKVPQLAIYFALSVYGRDAWTAIAERPGLSFFGGGALALVTAIMGQTMVGLEAWSGWVLVADFLTCLGSVAAMLGAACAITRYGGRLARAGAWVGRHTAGIYILHYPALMVLTVVAGGPLHDWPRALLATEAGRWAYPLLTTAIIVGAALLIEVAAERTGMGWLFRMPRRGRRPAQRGPAYRSRNAVSVP